jgi:lysozyme family protein
MGIVIAHILLVAAAAIQPPLYVIEGTARRECWEEEEMLLTKELRDEYTRLFGACAADEDRKEEIEAIITRIMKNRARYEAVEARTGVPWFVIGVIHNMEADGDFSRHLHNGDPLTGRTFQEPKGRPLAGAPPFNWEDSAVDALQYEGFDVWREWNTVPGTLFKIELYNGLGSRNHGVHSPYLWCGSFFDANGDRRREATELPIYAGGKYVKDHEWSWKAMSQQIGAAVLLRRMLDQGLIDFGAIAPAAVTLIATPATLNVRAADSTTSSVIRHVSHGERMVMITSRGDWTNVRLADGSIGWVASKFVQEAARA